VGTKLQGIEIFLFVMNAGVVFNHLEICVPGNKDEKKKTFSIRSY
jgi:hypothetical protein